MKLYIESSAVFSERSGIGHFTKDLIGAYHEKYPDQVIKLFGFKFMSRKFVPPIPADKTLGYRLVRWLPGRAYTGAFKHGVKIPIDVLIGAGKKDVVVFPNFVRWPLILNKRSIAFVHDLSFVFYGQYASPPNRDYMLKYVPGTVAKADHIITISESSRRDIAKHFNIPEDRISIVYPFIDTREFKRAPKHDIERMRAKLGLPEKYILSFCTIEPRKNIQGLLDAYAKLDSKIHKEFPLVLAGGKGWLNDEIHAKADRLIAKGLNIIRTGYIADADRPAVFSGATMLVFIPFYEGFGIPPLEAMVCGVPVITSNNSSLPEVIEDAGILVEADKPAQTTRAIKRLLDDSKLRQSMVQRGYKQAKKFNPAHSAEQFQQAINRVI